MRRDICLVIIVLLLLIPKSLLFAQSPSITVLSDSLDFTQVRLTETSDLNLTISNEGDSTLVINDVRCDGDFFSVEFADEIEIAPDEDESLEITFTPREYGIVEGLLTIVSNDPEQAELTIHLCGFGVHGMIHEIAQYHDEDDLGVFDCDVSGDFACLACGNEGMQIIDVSDPANPYLVVSCEVEGCSGVDIEGDYVYASSSDGMRVIDISNPRRPREVGAVRSPVPHSSVRVRDNYAYMSSTRSSENHAGLLVVDISRPDNPEAVGEWISFGWTRNVCPADRYLYLSALSRFNVMNISNPERPYVAAYVQVPSGVYDIVIDGDYAYAAASDEGVHIFDISRPLNPSEVGSFQTERNAYGLGVIGDYLFVADRRALIAYDISDPVNAFEAGYFRFWGRGYRIMFVRNLAYFSAEEGGLFIFDLSDFVPHLPELVIDREELEFDSVGVNEIAELSFNIWNAGFDDLIISGINSDHEYFTTNMQEQVNVLPDSTYEVKVYFCPEYLGEFEADLTIVSNDSARGDAGIRVSGTGCVSGIDEKGNTVNMPFEFLMQPVFPNPFNSTLEIGFEISRRDRVSIELLDLTGREVATLIDEIREAGYHRVTLNGEGIPAGLYFLRGISGKESVLQRVVLLK